MIYLLAIICSYKSGYTSDMAKNSDCQSVIVDLYKLVIPNAQDSEAKYFIEKFLYTDAKNNYYKQYSRRISEAITKAVGVRDDVDCFMFNNEVLKNRKFVRHMCVDAEDIEIPSELMKLAQTMPDAMNILNLSDNQVVME